MAEICLDYYKNEDKYSDGDIEQDILQIVERGKEVLQNENRYPVLYHLSPLRENILNWYPFKEKCSILEVGAGCGALTGVLCKKAKKVVSIELSKRRSTINYLRNSCYENLKIFVGNMNEMEIVEQFDYVVLNGVLEYAASFTEGDKPYHTFLNNLRKYLKTDGKLLIAIENRLGIKYFAGAPEDHTGEYFGGIQGYHRNSNVYTFSKKEMELLLRECEYSYYKFYYPYPDYKFPTEIFTDEYMNGYGRRYNNIYDTRCHLFSEYNVTKSLKEEGIVDRFSNSFLIEASATEWNMDKGVFYAKMSNDRKEDYQISTILYKDEKKYARKIALHPSAEMHLNKILINSHAKLGDKSEYLAGEKVEQGIIFPYIQETSAKEILVKYISKGEKERILSFIDNIFKECIPSSVMINYISEEFRHVFGEKEAIQCIDECINPANIDIIFDNIFKVGEKFLLIDNEWSFDFYIPKKFIVYRALNELYAQEETLQYVIERRELMQHYGISLEQEQKYHNWAHFFADEFVGCNTLNSYVKYMPEINVQGCLNNQSIIAGLYVDYGSGFSEENKIEQRAYLQNGKFEVSYSIPNGAKRLRWDPAERRICRCHLKKMITDKGEVYAKAINAFDSSENWEVFLDIDPQYSIELQETQISKLKIVGYLEYIDAMEIEKYVSNRQKNVLDEQRKEIEGNKREIIRLQNELEKIYESKGWKILQKYRKMKLRLMNRK